MAHAEFMRCANCNAEISISPGERIGFRDCCDSCNADLHSCLNCAHHDPAAYNECRESSAEHVSERERANRCEWFSPGGGVGGAGNQVRQGAIADLESLFKK